MAIITNKSPEEILQDRTVSNIARAVQAQKRCVQDIARLVQDQKEVVAVEYAAATEPTEENPEGTPEVQAVEGKTKLQVFIEMLGDKATEVQSTVALMVAQVNAASEEQITSPFEE